MSRNRIVDKEELLPEQIHYDLWLKVEDHNLEIEEREQFLMRKKAIELYLSNSMTQEQIHAETGISPRNLRRLYSRCIAFDKFGRVWGWRGLIPQKNIKSYELDLLSSNRNESRKTGEFNLLLEKHPDIKDKIENMYLGKKSETLEPVMSPKSIFKVFIGLCREKKIPLTEYPFNTDDMGKRAIERFLKRLSETRFTAASKRYGHDAHQKAVNTGIGEQNYPSIISPYQRVQFDGHRIDGVFAIRFTNPDGDHSYRVLDRIWVLSIIDEATRCVLSSRTCLNKEYGSSDVMLCARDGVIPHKRRPLTIPNLTYHDVGGFPSETIPQAEWAVWDEICFDNAKSHLANMVRDRLSELIRCTTNYGPVDMPMRRGFVERFFKTLEANGFHRMPNTTGGNYFDPRRDNPEGKAIQYYISIEDLEELLSVLVSNYNGTPNGGVWYLSPLVAMEKRIAKGMLPRLLEEEKRSSFAFLQINETRKVCGDINEGRRPYINYYGVEYRNDFLAQSGDLIGTILTLHINVDDIRTLRAFLPDGSELGVLAAAGKWSLTAHTLKIRQNINRLVRNKKLHFTTWDDPIFAYLVYIKDGLNKGVKSKANTYAHVKEVADGKHNQHMDESEREVVDQELLRSTELDGARRKLKEKQQSEKTSIPRRFKAKTF